MVVVDSVPNIQYTQYADRDVRLKGNARQAQPVNAAKPLRNPPEFRLQGKERAGGKHLRVERIALEKAKIRNGKMMEKIRQELTGKGIYIDVKI